MKPICFLLFSVYSLNAFNQYDLAIQQHFCDKPDSIYVIQKFNLVGTYQYETSDYFCDNGVLKDTIQIIEGPHPNTFIISDFSFGTWRSCYDIGPPTGDLVWLFEDGSLRYLGEDQYGDAYEIIDISVESGTWIFKFTNSYGEYATVKLTRLDGMPLPRVSKDHIPIDDLDLRFQWHDNSSSSFFLAQDTGLFSVTITDTFNQEFFLEFQLDDRLGNHPDFKPLLELYEKTEGNNWFNNSGWKKSIDNGWCNPCAGWHGIVCQNGRVTSITLPNNNLSGPMPESFFDLENLSALILEDNHLSGPLPQHLGRGQLINVDLSDNKFSDTIPPTFYQRVFLTNLDLSNNQLTGSIKEGFGNIRFLTELDLSNNQLKDTIPSSLGQLTRLSRLDLWGNKLEGSIPPSLGDLDNLRYLNLSFNQLKGIFPNELSFVSSLEELDLSHNKIEGEIPNTIEWLFRLKKLRLSHNQLSGPIPFRLSNVNGLNNLLLDNNNFSSCIPEDLDQFCRLGFADQFLDIEINGEIKSILEYEGVNTSNNPLLPWKGDFLSFCSGLEQIGAPCEDGFQDTSDEIITQNCVCSSPTNISDEVLRSIDIFPNPAFTNLTIKNFNQEKLKFDLIDIHGRHILSLKTNGNNDLSNIPKGFYLIQITDKKYHQAIKKLSIQ